MTNEQSPPTEAAEEASSGKSEFEQQIVAALVGATLQSFGLDLEENGVEIERVPSNALEVRFTFSANQVDRDFPLGDTLTESFKLNDISYGCNEGGYGTDGAAVYRFEKVAAIVAFHGSCGEFVDDNCDGYVDGTVRLIPAAMAEAGLQEERARLLRVHAARVVAYLSSGVEAFSPAEMGAAVRRAMLDGNVDPRRAAQRAELVRALGESGDKTPGDPTAASAEVERAA